jgi:manganese/zinc/iron transport system substrate-binding protein
MVWLASCIVLAAGCGGEAPSSSEERYPYPVVCTTGMVADIVKNVGGDHVQVTTLMGEGIDPHLYKASPGDVSKLNAARVIFFSGLHLEGKMGDIFVRTARKKPTYAVTEKIPEDRLIELTDGHYDPHVWFDVSLWSLAADTVRDALVEVDPEHAADYTKRANEYQAALAALDETCRQSLQEIPKDRRVLVTAHDAFHYFGRAYDIEVRAVQGVSTETEAGVLEINELVDFITKRKIKAVFVESTISERNIRALIEGCAARGHEVKIGGELFSDAMGKDGTPEGTYAGMVRHNVDTIKRALE